jgi:hypothetical protein
MPPKRKNTAASTATTGPKPKRNKPVFQSINSASTTSSNSTTKTRVSTLRTNATGRRGYYSREQSTIPSFNIESSFTPNPSTSNIEGLSAANTLLSACNSAALESGDQSLPNKIPKIKSKNTTVVSKSFFFCIYITYTNIVKAYRMACLSPNMFGRTTSPRWSRRFS